MHGRTTAVAAARARAPVVWRLRWLLGRWQRVALAKAAARTVTQCVHWGLGHNEWSMEDGPAHLEGARTHRRRRRAVLARAWAHWQAVAAGRAVQRRADLVRAHHLLATAWGYWTAAARMLVLVRAGAAPRRC
jgi:hypothetical protein